MWASNFSPRQANNVRIDEGVRSAKSTSSPCFVCDSVYPGGVHGAGTRLSISVLALGLACGSPGGNDETDTAESTGETGGASENPLPLVDPLAWSRVEAMDDPLASHRPDPVDCGIAGTYPEEECLEMDMSACNYLAIQQPALASVAAGDPVRLELFHFDLTSPEPTEAHLALLFDDVLAWELAIPVPGPANVLELNLVAPVAIVEGETQVQFHLHNHGQNTYKLCVIDGGTCG
jgi:hypothetical protein